MKRSHQIASLAGTGALQVMFVAANTVFVSRHDLLAAFATSFMISLIWTFNVKRVAFGDNYDRIAYAGGAAFGCAVGMSVAASIA